MVSTDPWIEFFPQHTPTPFGVFGAYVCVEGTNKQKNDGFLSPTFFLNFLNARCRAIVVCECVCGVATPHWRGRVAFRRAVDARRVRGDRRSRVCGGGGDSFLAFLVVRALAGARDDAAPSSSRARCCCFLRRRRVDLRSWTGPGFGFG